MSDLRIFIALEGESQGSFSRDELAQLWEQGEIDPAALFWHRGRTAWSPLAHYEPATSEHATTSAGEIQIVTLPEILGSPLERVIGIVGADVVHFVHTSAVQILIDAASGRSGASPFSTALGAARAECLEQLRANAYTMQADAVLSVSVTPTQALGFGGKLNSIGVSAVGTAVRLVLEPPPPHFRQS